MGVNLKYGTAGATGGGFSAQNGTLQPSFEDRIKRLPADDWQKRGPRSWKDRNSWFSLWPTCRFNGGGDSGQAYQPVGQGTGEAGMYEPFSCDGGGCQTLKFIKGTCVDASDVAIANATVQAFRSSDDAFAGYEATSRDDGSYDLATNFPGVNHYVVAYKAGSPDIGGTTVNTLVPTGIDGT